MSSLITNSSALQALQAASAASREIGAIEKRIATGLRVAGTADDSADYVVAQSLRSENLLWQTTAKGLARVHSIVDVAASGAEQISDLVVALREKTTLYQDADDAGRKALRADMEALVAQIDTVAGTSEFSGVNLLVGKPVVNTESANSYGSAWTAKSQAGFQVPMAALPPGSSVQPFSSARHVLPPGARTPSTYPAARAAMQGYGSTVQTFDAGGTAGRFNLLLEQTPGADAVEIWQNGVRVAATGRAYAANAAPVGAGINVAGPEVISFDYDPAKGQNLEFRFSTAGGASNLWYVTGLELQDPAEPVPSPILEVAPSSIVTTTATFDPVVGYANPEQAAKVIDDSPDLDGSPEGVSQIVTVPGGSQSGRVDLVFDAFDLPDTLEVYQDSVRIAATGQAYAPGGGAVGNAMAVSGVSQLSFDYDPAKGPLSFVFNGGGADPDSAWVVGSMILQDPGTPRAAISKGTSYQLQNGFGPVRYDFNVTPDGDFRRIRSRDSTSAGLGLDLLPWGNPDVLMDTVRAAEGRIRQTLSYLGNKSRAFSMLEAHAARMSDISQGAIGTLVDSDLAKDAAALQASQVKQQLATQALAIANKTPQFLLNLFQ